MGAPASPPRLHRNPFEHVFVATDFSLGAAQAVARAGRLPLAEGEQAAFDHALAASLAICLNALAAVLVLIRPDSSFLGVGPGSLLLFMLEPDSLLVLAAYVLALWLLYHHAAGW